LESVEAGKKRKAKIERIEQEINQNQSNIEETKKKLQANEKNYQEKISQIEKELEKEKKKKPHQNIYCSKCLNKITTSAYYQNHDNSQEKYCQTCAEKINNNSNSSNNKQFDQCEYCKKILHEGEQYFYFPQDPQQRMICVSCKPQLDNEI
jgi:hypothetical protein